MPSSCRRQQDPADLPRLLDPALRATVVEQVRASGYLYVTLDLLGYRTGSLNEALTRRPRQAPQPTQPHGGSEPTGAP